MTGVSAIKFFVISLFLAPALAMAAPVGKVVALKGDGLVLRGESKIALKRGLLIEQNDIIETNDTGITEIEFNDYSMVTVGTGSQLIIDKFVYNPNASEEDASALRVGKGFFHFVSGKLAREKVSIKTPVSTIGIRGTELAGEVGLQGKTFVSLVECCVDLQSQTGVTSLDRVGTFSEVKSSRSAPSAPALTPDWWAEKAVAALGKSRDELGLEELDMPEYEAEEPKEAPEAAEPVNNYKAGPKNRKSYPSFKGSLIE